MPGKLEDLLVEKNVGKITWAMLENSSWKEVNNFLIAQHLLTPAKPKIKAPSRSRTHLRSVGGGLSSLFLGILPRSCDQNSRCGHAQDWGWSRKTSLGVSYKGTSGSQRLEPSLDPVSAPSVSSHPCQWVLQKSWWVTRGFTPRT